jgi:hypothetical protein
MRLTYSCVHPQMCSDVTNTCGRFKMEENAGVAWHCRNVGSIFFLYYQIWVYRVIFLGHFQACMQCTPVSLPFILPLLFWQVSFFHKVLWPHSPPFNFSPPAGTHPQTAPIFHSCHSSLRTAPYIWETMLCVPFCCWLVSLNTMIHPFSCRWHHSILLHDQVVLHSVPVPRFASPFISWWTRRLSPWFG